MLPGDSLVFEFWGQVDPAKLGGKLGLEVGGGPISFEAELGRTWADPLFSARLYGNRLDTEGVSMFEPIGGSAPKYTGQNVINPMAAIAAAHPKVLKLAAAM